MCAGFCFYIYTDLHRITVQSIKLRLSIYSPFFNQYVYMLGLFRLTEFLMALIAFSLDPKE